MITSHRLHPQQMCVITPPLPQPVLGHVRCCPYTSCKQPNGFHSAGGGRMQTASVPPVQSDFSGGAECAQGSRSRPAQGAKVPGVSLAHGAPKPCGMRSPRAAPGCDRRRVRLFSASLPLHCCSPYTRVLHTLSLLRLRLSSLWPSSRPKIWEVWSLRPLQPLQVPHHWDPELGQYP